MALFNCIRHLIALSAGSPFTFIVVDPEKVCASGDGLDMVRACKLATFIISAPAGRLCDFVVRITGGHQIYSFNFGALPNFLHYIVLQMRFCYSVFTAYLMLLIWSCTGLM